MNILMVAPEPVSEPRGTPISVGQRLEMLSSLGYHVDLVTYHIGDSLNIKNVRIHRTPAIPTIGRIAVGPSWPKVLLDILLFFKVCTMMLRKRYTLIHSHEEASFFCVFLALIFRIPHLYDMHSRLPKQFANSKYGKYRIVTQLFSRLERQVLAFSQAVLTVDPDLADYVVKSAPHVVHERIENLPVQYSVDKSEQIISAEVAERFDFTDESVLVVYTGTFEAYQGLDLLMNAAKIVCSHAPEVQFILVGGTIKQIERYRSIAEQFNLQTQIHFTGTVSLGESIQYMNLADILVSPRIGGTAIPLKVYSYLQAGKAIVATDIRSHNQVFSAETSELVEPLADSIATGILRLVLNPNQRQTLAQKALRMAERQFAGDVQAAKLGRVYEALLHPQLGRSLDTVTQVNRNRPKLIGK